MPLSVDPSLRHLDGCGCCSGVTAQTPTAIDNRPGLSAIAYRAGTQPSFKATILAAISASSTPALRALQTRDDDDFTVALADAWATALDVLTFYQERIANESYLRTATERYSVAALARLIGYEPRPGLAAATQLAFTLEAAPGAPSEVVLDAGLRVQSVPGPGEQPQVFETIEPITARPAWNAMVPRRTVPLPLFAATPLLWLAGTATALKPGDPLLIIAGGQWALRRISAVAPDDPGARTRVDLEPVDYGPLPVTAPDGVYALRQRAAPFGHNAPLKPPPDKPADIENATEWDLTEPDKRALWLDAAYDQLSADTWAVVERSWFWLGWLRGLPIGPGFHIRLLRRIDEVRTGSRAGYGITGRVSQLRLDDDWLDGYEWSLAWLRDAAVFLRSEPLVLAEVPLAGALPATTFALEGELADLPVGRAVVVTGRPHGAPADAPLLSELAEVKSVTVSGAYTTLTLAKALATVFDRQSVTINANVARATHGETVSEVLGSGDARQPYQRFTLRAGPLTQLAAANPRGAAPSLEVRVGDLRWTNVPFLYGQPAGARVYAVRQEPDGRATVQFGDGQQGARLPSGSEQVRARYRRGLGKAGNVQPGQLSTLLSRPLGLKAATNHFAAEGGADPEPLDRARQNAPLTVLTLERVVSLRDYEDFARAFSGVAKALATWTWDGQRQGVVLTIAGDGGAAITDTSDTYARLLESLREYGDARVPLRLGSYTPVTFALAAVVTKDPAFESAAVELAVRDALLAAYAFENRQFGQGVALSHVMAVIQGVPGVVGVDVDALHRTDLVGGGGLRQRLPAFAPRPGDAFTTAPAELLTLDSSGISLVVS
ncbi:MAG: putative baseplate assembly protein [Dehalococcoidia bacterium]|nr:putative baseplate assembly protein [Dehalococcoidia bacterium]